MYYSTREGTSLIADGGRTIRGPRGERFRLSATPGRRARLLVRVGGPPSLPVSDVPHTPQPLVIRARLDEATTIEVGRIKHPAASASFHDLALDIDPSLIASGTIDLHVSSAGAEPYRIFHYYLLQEERPRR